MAILPLSTLTEIVAALPDVEADGSVNPTPTIYASEPWSAGSLAVVEWSPERVGLPAIACENRLVRFIEVDVAKRFLRERMALVKASTTGEALANDLVAYVQNLIATGDAYGVGAKSKKVSQ